jgi:hypothetical protein
MTPLQEQAISVLDTYVQRRAVVDKANDIIAKAVQAVGDDFSGLHLPGMDGEVLAAFCGLLDAIWGQSNSGLASYYLHECVGPLGHGGGIQCCCSDKIWKLMDVGELRAYLEHTFVCEGRKELAS